jgi:hypothetical protein
LEQKVAELIEQGRSKRAVERLTIDSCGKSRIPLNGLVQDLHRANALVLYDELSSSAEK